MKGSLLPLIAKINSTDAPFLNLTVRRMPNGANTAATLNRLRELPGGENGPWRCTAYPYSLANLRSSSSSRHCNEQWKPLVQWSHAIQRSGTALRPVTVSRRRCSTWVTGHCTRSASAALVESVHTARHHRILTALQTYRGCLGREARRRSRRLHVGPTVKVECGSKMLLRMRSR